MMVPYSTTVPALMTPVEEQLTVSCEKVFEEDPILKKEPLGQVNTAVPVVMF